jgi:hypothetical protein
LDLDSFSHLWSLINYSVYPCLSASIAMVQVFMIIYIWIAVKAPSLYLWFQSSLFCDQFSTMQPERNLKEKSTNNALHSQGLKASWDSSWSSC